MEADGGEPFVEAANDVEDKSAVGDRLAEVAEVLRLPLVEPTVIGDRKVALTEVVEINVGVEGARRLIAEKLRNRREVRWKQRRRGCGRKRPG